MKHLTFKHAALFFGGPIFFGALMALGDGLDLSLIAAALACPALAVAGFFLERRKALAAERDIEDTARKHGGSRTTHISVSGDVRGDLAGNELNK